MKRPVGSERSQARLRTLRARNAAALVKHGTWWSDLAERPLSPIGAIGAGLADAAFRPLVACGTHANGSHAAGLTSNGRGLEQHTRAAGRAGQAIRARRPLQAIITHNAVGAARAGRPRCCRFVASEIQLCLEDPLDLAFEVRLRAR